MDDDNFTHMQNRPAPLRVEIPKFACWVRTPT